MMLYGHDEGVANWVSYHLNGLNFEQCAALGVVRADTLIAGVVFNNYHIHQGYPVSMEVTIHSIDKSWATRHTLRHIFAYPFVHVKVKRLQATVSRKNKNVRRFLVRLGFTFEGYGRQAWHLGGDAAVFSMLPHECKWIDNERFSIAPPSTRSECRIGSADTIKSADRAV